jgi:hypothetical protein
MLVTAPDDLLPAQCVVPPLHHPTPKCFVDNWRWAGVPFFLRTGKKMAEGQRIISIAFHGARSPSTS